MKSTLITVATILGAVAATFAASPDADATDKKTMTNAAPAASAASDASVPRTLKFTTRQAVPGTLTSHRDAPIVDGYKAQFRFKGQTDMTPCVVHFPKVGQQVQPGATGTVMVKCSAPWQLYDNGLAFDAFEGDRKVAEGTLRP